MILKSTNCKIYFENCEIDFWNFKTNKIVNMFFGAAGPKFGKSQSRIIKSRIINFRLFPTFSDFFIFFPVKSIGIRWNPMESIGICWNIRRVPLESDIFKILFLRSYKNRLLFVVVAVESISGISHGGDDNDGSRIVFVGS